MSDCEEDFSVDDKIVPHPWEHSTTVNHEGELSIEEYEDMQERLRIFNETRPELELDEDQ